ncbi:MAG: SDR family NAD(P)-dependent oxidoreductase, partial [Anaerolineae bacterium]|nr:SDR family NAD(P)-dependent oxidoreductase [Anaerolineae bacterium]
ALVAATLERFGRIDVLVNNAGVTASGPVHTLSIDRLRHAIDVNLAAAICLTNLVLPFMLARGVGRIVNVASGLGAVAMPFFSAYSASKHGLIAFSDALRRETEGTGIGVTSVLPGWTQSEMVPPPLEQRLREMGFSVDTADCVAECTVEGLLDGKPQIIFGGVKAYIGVWLERHFPLLLTLYWRAALTPEFIALSRSQDYPKLP